MIPTIGRIVLVNLGADTRPGAQPEQQLRPAIVVRTWGSTPEAAINVQLFPDGGNDVGLEYLVSNQIDPSKGSLCLTSLIQGDHVGGWSWPPRA